MPAPSVDKAVSTYSVSSFLGAGATWRPTSIPSWRGSVGDRKPQGQRARQARNVPAHVYFSRWVVENKWFTVLTTILTIYALTGDDFRLMFTHMPADSLFNCFTIICLVVFTVEIIVSTFGKDDYFLSFWFVLDSIATATLILDLTFVNDLILGDEEELKNARGSRTARLGARTARLVRVLRLVRILKLYKAMQDAKAAKAKRIAKAQNSPGEDEDDDEWEEMDANLRMDQLHRESQVGKKLSELTTRRVICLVLTMMLLSKLVRIDRATQMPTSAQYGAEIIKEAYDKLLRNPNDDTRKTYQDSMLEYVYYHNWYSGRYDDAQCPDNLLCPYLYDAHLFWVGLVSSDKQVLKDKAEKADMRPDEVQKWIQESKKQESDANMFYTYGSMPSHVEKVLGKPWGADCNTRSGTKFRLGFSLIGQTSDAVAYPVKCPEDLRRNERSKFTAGVLVSETEYGKWSLAFYFDIRPFVQWESVYSLLTTAYICLALCFASLAFSNDANRLVLHPLENMISKVDTFRENPLAAMKVADEEFKREEMTRAKTKRLESKRTPWTAVSDVLFCSNSKCQEELMETVVLEKTIIKLGSLLVLGFGQAGAQIIEHNMHGVDSACVDAMIEGTRVECIIGATRIRDFSTATEVLQAKVMTFVNQIAEIVHGVVDEFHGYASRNNGDLFLMIWRKTVSMDAAKLSRAADMSMLAFTRILGAVHRSPVLANYRGHPGLQQRLGKNCRVHLSSGLHYGWAIEGAIGSEFKIDASYLSPNVSIAETVERATKLYGVSILVSESVIKICTPAVAAKCRLIDRVIITGSVKPMELYVVDLDYMSLTVEPPPPMHINWTSKQRFRVRQFLEAEKSAKLHETTKIVNLFNENSEIATMRFRYTLEFVHVFNMGYQNYNQGEWEVARRLLSRTHTMLGIPDGPSRALLTFMEASGFEAPDAWQGIRELGLANFQ